MKILDIQVDSRVIDQVTKKLLRSFLLVPVDIFAISDFDDVNNEYCILDRIENTISALPDPIPLTTRQFHTTRRSWIVGQ